MDKCTLLINKLNIIQKSTNRIETDINDINLRIENINTENAQTNDILKFDGANWIPSTLPLSADAAAVSRAQTSASESLASKNAAIAAASESLASKNVAILRASESLASKDAAAISASESLASKVAAAISKISAYNSRINSESLIDSKARINNPVFTGSVNLPTGATVNSIPILLANNKIISRVYRTGGDAHPDYTSGGNNYDFSVVRFHEVSINTFGTPTLNSGSHTIQSSTTLWGNDGQRTYFTVPSGRSGIYRILGNITGQFGLTDFQGGVGLRMNCIIYRVRSNVHKSICYSETRVRHVTDNFGAMLDELTMNIDQMFELNSGDEIYIKTRAGHPYSDNSNNAFRLKAGDSPGKFTNLTIMEM